jgi:hypothetical protein
MVLATGLCSNGGKIGGHSHKHYWTEEERAIIRRDYKGTNRSAAEIASRISLLTGDTITKCAVKGQTVRLGISFKPQSKLWSPEENERLGKLITIYPISIIAKMMKRSEDAVRVRATRLHYSARVRDGWFTKSEVSEILGVDHKKVQSWVETGKLIADRRIKRGTRSKSGSLWHIFATDLSDFIKAHALELTGRNVDLFIIVELLKGGLVT